MDSITKDWSWPLDQSVSCKHVLMSHYNTWKQDNNSENQLEVSNWCKENLLKCTPNFKLQEPCFIHAVKSLILVNYQILTAPVSFILPQNVELKLLYKPFKLWEETVILTNIQLADFWEMLNFMKSVLVLNKSDFGLWQGNYLKIDFSINSKSP